MASDKQSRARELERVFQMRRGHAPQISISDDNHHVTEAIGDLYGGDSDNEAPKRSSRPLSFLPSPNGDSIQSFGSFEPFDPFPTPTSPPAKSPLRPIKSFEKPAPKVATSSSDVGITIPQRKASLGRTIPNGHMSPPLSRSNSDTASQQFPLNNLDYESSPAGLAQELSNLQAIRRMSMGVNNADPDLPSFKSANSPPASPTLSQEDEQQLFWVPARLHPELAPKEFKTFIEEKVDRIRRRSGDSDTLSPDGALGRKGSGDGLRRKKSMLSRQIDTGSGYKDGADRLERKRSESQSNGGLANLAQLEHIVEDPVALVRRMSMDSKGSDEGADDDSPIIAGKPGGMGTLKRSTRTTYRRGSLRKGGPALSRRLGTTRQGDTDTEDSPATSPTHPPPMPQIPLSFSRVQSEPIHGAFESASNFSRPQRRRSPPAAGSEQRPDSPEEARPSSSGIAPEERPRPQARVFHSRIASNGRTTAPLPGYVPPQQQQQQPVPQIIETPPPQEQRPLQLPERLSSRQPPPQFQQQQQQKSQPQSYHPPAPQQQQPQQPPPQPQPQPRQAPPIRPNPPAQAVQAAQTAQASPIKPAQTFDELIQHPMPLPGNNTRVDSLSVIPSAPEEKKDRKSEDKKDDGPRKTSWGWLTGGDKHKEREKKEKEERDKELAKKVKNKLSKPQEKCHDDARLDVLQTSLQANQRGRESVVVDRESVRLEEERKKESTKKAAGEGKKEKEPGLLSSIFGGGKKKSEKESSSKKSSTRGLSPEPPPRILKPDIDYNWTRFSILEERAIYRMAHIKLANPRRELYSQVLLSNFMYSYLAKVQQMHPQISIGNSKQARQAQQQQKKEQMQQQQQQQHQPQQHISQQQQQPDEFAQYQRYQKQQEQSDKNNEWPSYQQQQQQQQAPQENGQHQQMYNQNPRDSHHSQYSTNGGGGAGYNVSNTQKYLGQPGQQGYHQQGYSESSDQSSRDQDDMW